MITLTWLYVLTGVMFAAFALLSVSDRANRKRFCNAAFWALVATSFLAGDTLGDLGNGILVLCLVALAGFGALGRAFKLGAPPHAGIAPGVDRIVMLIADEPNIREVIAFPMNQRAEDLLMGAPAPVSDHQLKELHLKLDVPAPEAPDDSPVHHR